MRVAYLAAGAAGMYCGSCLHDNTLAAALIGLGEDVALVPTYTPLRTDDEDVSMDRVFLGGINVYLQQKSALFRHLPRSIEKWLDRPALLNRFSGKASAVDPSSLADLTLSMLRGNAGRQRKEFDRLTAWLADEFRPDIVHLSNALLSGTAPMLRERLAVPIVCNLSGEDIFLDKLPSETRRAAYDQIGRNAGMCHALVAFNQYYADLMIQRLELPADVVHIIPSALNLNGHGTRQPKDQGAPAVVGFLARICHDKGLHLLIEACERLATEKTTRPFCVRAAGYLGTADREYLAKIERHAAAGPLTGRFEYVGELDRPAKIAFLQSLDLFSTPTCYPESKGLPALEALANAVPVVLPNHGSFPEIIGKTGGGLLFRPHDAADLAEKVGQFLADPVQADAYGRQGQDVVRVRHDVTRTAGLTCALYGRLRKSSVR